MPSLLRKLKRSAGSHLGIDIGSHSIKVVELRTSARGSELTATAATPIPPDSREVKALAAQLRQLLRDQGITTNQAVVNVGGPGVAVRRLTIPVVPEAEIPGAIRWQAQKSFPFPLEDALVALQILSRSEGGGQDTLELLVVAATREAVLEKVAVLQQAGLNCLGVMGEAHAWAQTWQKGGVAGEEGQGAQAVVDLGAAKTDIHVFQGGILQFSREISTSANTLTETISGVIGGGESQVELNSAQAEALKHQYGIPAEGDQNITPEGIALSALGVRMRPVLEKLETEISRSLDYYRYQHEGEPITRLLLAGGGCQLKGIQSSFGEWFDLEVEYLDPLASLLGEGEGAVPNLPSTGRSVAGVATGLSLPVPPQFNLLPADLLEERKSKISAKVAYAALGLLLLAPLGQYVWQGEQKVEGIRQAAAAKRQQIDRYQSLMQEYQRLQQRSAELDTKLGQFPEMDTHSVPLAPAMKIISREIPDNITLTEINLQPEQEIRPRLRLRGLIFGPEMDAFSELSGFMERLENGNVFSEIEVGNVAESEVQRPAVLDFEIFCVFQ
jgi:type IV pilus assembly protein PilM